MLFLSFQCCEPLGMKLHYIVEIIVYNSQSTISVKISSFLCSCEEKLMFKACQQ